MTVAAPLATVSPPALARTYNSRSYADPWDCAEDYFRVLDYAAEHPQKGSSAVASALDLPRSRVRPWLDGTIPDPVRGIHAAADRGWLDLESTTPKFRGLNAFTAWVFSGGSINRNYVPYFAVSNDDLERDWLDQSATLADIELDFTRSGETGRATELRPIQDASVLGRVLSVLGAPVGPKNAGAAISLPQYLRDGPERIRREFLQVYLTNRAHVHDQKATLTFQEERAEGYLRRLAEFIGDCTGERVTVSGTNVIVSAAAAREIQSWPRPLQHG